ncbi:MAG: hypothetical protein KKB59_19200 [Spirochaetes bacterium]|nr:hypothetical protein [Spirochaetota bacterium]
MIGPPLKLPPVRHELTSFVRLLEQYEQAVRLDEQASVGPASSYDTLEESRREVAKLRSEMKRWAVGAVESRFWEAGGSLDDMADEETGE